jgi:CRP/FNR family transcriptional regulator, cyclic AMP receptor protein
MNTLAPTNCDIAGFLARFAEPRTIISVKPKEFFFVQDAPAGSMYYLQTGRARLSVASKGGKEATIMLLVPGDFFGEESLAGAGELYPATAAAITSCTALKLNRLEMVRAMHGNHALSAYMVKFLLGRSMRVQADLVDQLFNSTEKRLARILLLMADHGHSAGPEGLIPPITQETLADLIGTTRSQVNFFMTRFRANGFIEYKKRIRVHRSLLNVLFE